MENYSSIIGLILTVCCLLALFSLKGDYYDPVKRIIDITVSFISLIVLSPLLIITAVLIKITSSGPIFYHANRAGVKGRPIAVLKFRTMIVGADIGGTITAGGDDRITGLGKLLRASKIDETPQFWNILRGDMSIVGPRPESMNIVDRHYSGILMEALDIRPGLSCPGALLYYVHHETLRPPGGMTMEEFYAKNLLIPKLEADIHYVRNRCLSYDINLIIRTVWVLFCKWSGGTPSYVPPKINL